MRIIIGLILGLVLGLTQAVAQEMSWEDRNQAGEEAYERGDYGEAERQWKAGFEQAKKFGPDDPRLATNLNNLAEVYRIQGKLAIAEPLQKRALALGENHPISNPCDDAASKAEKHPRKATGQGRGRQTANRAEG